MQPTQLTRLALLIAVIVLALTGATVSPTTSGLTDEEVVTFDEIEAATDWNESSTAADEARPNETPDENENESDGGSVSDDGNESDDENGIETEQIESSDQTEARGAGSEELETGIAAVDARNVSATESDGRGTDETAPNASNRR